MTLLRKLTTPALTAFFLVLPPVLTSCSTEEAATEVLAALEAEYDAAQEALSEAQDSLPEMSEEPDSAERAAFRAMMDERSAQYEELTNSFIPRYEALAEEFWGTGAGLEAKLWALSRTNRPDLDAEEEEREAAEEAREARIAEEAEAIFEVYGDSPHMEKLVENAYFLPEEQAEDYMARLRENSPQANVRAAAIYYPASRKLSRLRMEEEFGRLGRDEEEDEEETDSEEDADPREAINADLRLLIDEYGDIPMGGSTYGAVAYAHLNAHPAEELAIGQPAPEIIGTNVDGEEMRLSDFRGKVVVIDFWGDW